MRCVDIDVVDDDDLLNMSVGTPPARPNSLSLFDDPMQQDKENVATPIQEERQFRVS